MAKLLKWLFGIVVFAAATAAAVWLAGFFFFAFSKTNPIGKTDFSTWWTYWQFYQEDTAIAKRLMMSLAASILLAWGVPLLAVIASLRKARSLHGEARFANASEINKAGLFAKDGIIVGKWKDRYLMFSGAQFVLLAAPTRSGKGVGIVIPNLLNWPESVVVLDVKLENFLITSKFRAQWGQEIYLFNPFAITGDDGSGNPLHGRTHRYNPLGYISDDPRLRVTDILAIGYSLYPGEGREAFFDDAARNLFLGLTLYLCETPSLPRTMGELLRQSSGKGQPIKEHIQAIINTRNYREFGDISLLDAGSDRTAVISAIANIRGCSEAQAQLLCAKLPLKIAQNAPKADLERIEKLLTDAGAQYEVERRLELLQAWDGEGQPPLSAECVDALNRFTATSHNTMSSIMATFNVPLTIWASPIVDAATSANDFDLRDVRKHRMSIYLGIPANKLDEAKMLLNMFYTQLVNLNTNQLLHATPALKYTCLMLDDEFTAPGRIGAIDKANAYMAGYGLRLLTIVQSPGQLEREPPGGYGRESARTFVTNHACQILFTPKHQQDANEYSEMLGYYTFKAKGLSRQFGAGRGGRSESESDQRRALMLPQELREMSQRQQIISVENTKPILCDKIIFFAEPTFMNRLKSASRKLADLGKRLPSKKEFESIWGAGELAAPVPALDLDLHEAVVQTRLRLLTAADVEHGIALDRLALDTSKIAPVPDADGIGAEQVEAFVNDFFNALDAANYGQGEDNEALDDDGESAASDVKPDAGLSHDKDILFSGEPQDDEAAITSQTGQNTPMLDLSILDRPTAHHT